MSIVAVHGPNTFGSKNMWNTTNSYQAMAVSPDGTKWRFVPVDQSQPAANYDWTWTHTSGTAGGSPASPINDTKILELTFPAGPSTKTITLTLNGVAQSSIVVTVPAAGSQVSPMMMQMPGDGEESEGGEDEFDPNAPDQEWDAQPGFDPAAHTVTEVIGYVEDNPDELEGILELEQQGKNRVTLISHLEGMRQ